MGGKVMTFYERELKRISNAALPHHLYVQLRQSRAFMERNHARGITLGTIAAAAHLSPFHYLRLFRRVYGLTPRQYLRDVRIAQAKTLLRQGLSVTSVCLEVGYSSLPTFSQVFKRGTGSSPLAFQHRYKSNRE